MILGCIKCRTRFRVDDEKIRPEGVKVRCSRCAYVFKAYPSDGEKEPEGASTSTRRVEPAAMIALALGTSDDERTAIDNERIAIDNVATSYDANDVAIDESQSELNSTSEFAPVTVPDGVSTRPAAVEEQEPSLDIHIEDTGLGPMSTSHLDAVRGVLGDQSADPFAELDAVEEHSEDTLVGGGVSSASDRLDDVALPELQGPSLDLPISAPLTSAFLDPGVDRPSRDIGYALALEEDFLGLGVAERLDEDLIPSSPPRLSTQLPAEYDGNEATRVPLAQIAPSGLETDNLIPHGGRRGGMVSRWPTFVGICLGLAISSLFFPGWSPPFDRVAKSLYPAAELRLSGALEDIRSERATAFPYRAGNTKVVIVRGEAVHVGNESYENVRATVLMLEGNKEVDRASAPLGVIPTPSELKTWLTSETSVPELTNTKGASTYGPGDRLPFLVYFVHPAHQAMGRRYRVEFTGRKVP